MPDPSIWVILAVLGLGISIAVVQGRDHERLARLERKLNALLRHFEVDPTKGAPLSDRVKELALDPSKKIQAIKAYREETGASLVEAKTAIEDFASNR
jgi:hypothetical protein